MGRIFPEFEPINYIECIYLKKKNPSILEICIGGWNNCAALTSLFKKPHRIRLKKKTTYWQNAQIQIFCKREESDIVGSWTSFEWLLLSAWKESTHILPSNPPYVLTNEWKNILFANINFFINCIWRKWCIFHHSLDWVKWFPQMYSFMARSILNIWYFNYNMISKNGVNP